MNSKLAKAQERALDIVQNKVGNLVPNGKIQYATLRAMVKLKGDTKTLEFNFKESATVNRDLENLLKDGDIVVGYGLGFGIGIVPIVDGVEWTGNAKFISYPHEDIFPKAKEAVAATGTTPAIPAEKFGVIDAIRGLLNGKLSFATNQTTRLQDILMSDYMVLSQNTDVINYGVEHKALLRSYPMAGGRDNMLTIKIPGNTNLDALKNTPDAAYYATFELDVILIASSKANKDTVYAQLTS